MALHQEDMSLVPDQGEAVPEGWYHVRVAKVTEGSSNEGKPKVDLQMKIQNEGPHTGRMIFASPSLQAHALFSLKAYYTAAGYRPAPGQGHDPDNLLDAEFWVGVEHKIVDGKTLTDIKPFNVRSIQDGPGKAIGAKA